MNEGHVPAAGYGRVVAIVGSGPRGLSVLERMAVRLGREQPSAPLSICLFDAVEVGCGHIWRTDQPEYLLMNTAADEITMFSGPPRPNTAPRPGAGPSLAQWWQEHHHSHYPGPNSYAPRALYGQYLHFVLDTIERCLPQEVSLLRIRQAVVALHGTQESGYHLEVDDGSRIHAQRIVLTTGHATPRLVGEARRLHAFAEDRPRLTYIPSAPVADMPLDEVRAGSAVGILGLGLSFYDVMAALTLGRGGQFYEEPDGQLRYEPSGHEPQLFAGSRSGMLMPARAVNQKPSDQIYEPVVFTESRVAALTAGERPDFARDVFPWIRAEMNLAATLALGRPTAPPEILDQFVRDVTRAARRACPDVAAIARRHGLRAGKAVELDSLAQPFRGQVFASPDAFHRALRVELQNDLREADRGNLDSPRKASLDVLRDVRWLISRLVDFAGLTPSSHQRDFLGWYAARSAFLVSGPPRIRLRQALALMSAGVLRVLGPQTSFVSDTARGRFVGRSAAVRQSDVLLDAVIDARIPVPDVRVDTSPLTLHLRRRGAIKPYRNHWASGTAEGTAFETGGIAVTPSPYHPLNSIGTADRGICVLGIPTEHTRWFMTMGGRRPGSWSQFDQDADDIAASVLHKHRPITPVPAYV
ncbi:FAD/NAD(P)-binding protein [Streptomyces kanamyceticus]|uniref:FAD/NAD(P)-binding protein n=1 Tax=Streptomyces kanamyceticus TaxID=1967 RepID=UPI0037DDAED2